MSDKIALTTGKYGLMQEQAQQLAVYYGVEYIERRNKGINKLMEMHDLLNLLVLSAEGLTAYAYGCEEKLRFHPGMAVPRLKLAKDGQREPLLRAVDPFAGMRILDCTLGLASDAVTLALYVGENGHVTGLEAAKALYMVTDYGLKNYRINNKKIDQALERVSVRHMRYEDFLANSNEQFDAIYFDPMFDHGLYKSSGINALRPFAEYAPLDKNALKAALKLAPKAVVKFRQNADIGMDFDEIIKGKYSPIAFGVCYRR